MSQFVVANWKMQLTLAESLTLAKAAVPMAERMTDIEIVLAPSLPWLGLIESELHPCPPNLKLASQVVSQWETGAYTGDVSAKQLRHLADFCLVGHSERRRYHHEHGAVISAQIKQLHAHAIRPIICFGELTARRRGSHPDDTNQVVRDLESDLHDVTAKEIEGALLAYEPLWAIGTHHPAQPEQIAKTASMVGEWFGDRFGFRAPILYGGSVEEDSVADIAGLPEIGGVLVGGASLHRRSLEAICRATSRRVV